MRSTESRSPERPSPPLRLAFFLLRLITLLLLLAAILGISPVSRWEEVESLILIDRSRSMGSAEKIEALTAEVEELLRADGPLSYGYFGEEAFLSREGPAQIRLEVTNPGLTRIDRAIRLATGALAEREKGRIILLSDGKSTGGDPLAAAELAGELGLPIFPIAIEPPPPREAQLLKLDISSRVGRGESFTLSATYYGSENAPGILILYRNGEEIGRERLELEAGGDKLEYELAIEEPGLHSLEAELLLPGFEGTLSRLGGVINVRGEPAVLLVSTPESDASHLARALRTQGIDIKELSSRELSAELDRIDNYSALILNEVPAYDLSLDSMERISAYVRDLGGGLLMLGGDGSFGSGGYFQTPIEELLPVEMDPAASLFVPTMSMLTLLDTSGSMAKRNEAGESKLEILKTAVIAAAELLNPAFQIGVLGFDAAPTWVLPFTEAGEREEIRTGLKRLSAGGGTELYPALEEAYRGLISASAAVKHLIILSDGLVQQAPFEELVVRMAADGITVTTVAVGTDSDRELLEKIARWGGGRSYFARAVDSAPRIFASESMIVARRMLQDETFFPGLGETHPILLGFEERELPPLFGFQTVYPKRNSRVILTAVDTQPLLALFRPGLGRSAAFASSFDTGWGREWIAWPRFPRFAAQLVRWTARPGGDDGALLRLEGSDAGTRATLEVKDPGGEPYVLENPRLAVESSSGVEFVPLESRAPGRYEARLDHLPPGEIKVSAYGASFLTRAGFINRSGREELPGPANTRLLSGLAEAGGGRVITEPAELSQASPRRRRVSRPIPLVYLTTALCLLLIDVLLRLAAGRGERGIDAKELAERIEARRNRERRRDPSFWFGRE